MISEIRSYEGRETQADSFGRLNRRELPLMCPHCQQPINLATGLCGNRQIDAILRQAERIGAELECHRCGLRFVFHHTGTMNSLKQRKPPSMPKEKTGLREKEVEGERVFL